MKGSPMAKQKTKKPIRPITEETIDDPATIEEFAAYLRLSYSTVYRMVRDSQIKAVRVREQWRINVTESLKMLGL